MRNIEHKQKGIALIQVLIITAIMSVLAIYLNQTAKQQVQIAKLYQDKTQAELNVYSLQNELILNLLTEQPEVSKSQHPITGNWNFYGDLFKVNESLVTLQDQGGLLNAHYIDKQAVTKLLSANGVSFTDANRVAQNLLEWQNIDRLSRFTGQELARGEIDYRYGGVPYLGEFSHIAGVTPKIQKLLNENLSIYSGGYFNPLTSPRDVLAVYTTNEAANEIERLRRARQLSHREFSDITGITEDEFIQFYSSNVYAMHIQSDVGESRAFRKLVIKVNPTARLGKPPVNIFYVQQ